MTCAELEILLCDYLDGTLRPAERTALESHLAGCSACAELAKEVAAVAAFIETVAVAQPPAELLTRILHEVPAGRQVAAERKSWWRRLAGGWIEGVLQPRYAMGMAMTVLSLAMLARFAHIEPRPLRASDLDPVKAWQTIDDRTHRVWDRAMKYYDNLRLVIEIQSRLKEWTDEEQTQPAAAGALPRTGAGYSPAPASGTPSSGTNDKR
ncbi:MAG TPA: zf-HC2 domain-containing protein [Bryobacteraceae bacterium]|nr:zf-HC2 domain-containing protein [Bryobacteraceae bacterium]